MLTEYCDKHAAWRILQVGKARWSGSREGQWT